MRTPPEFTLLKEEAKAKRLSEAKATARLAEIVLSALKINDVNHKEAKL